MKTKFHEYLTKIRRQKGYTQAQMAEQIGVSRSTYTNYESGNRRPDYEVLERISDVLECSMDELFGRTFGHVTKCNIIREEATPYHVTLSKEAKQEEKPRLAIGVQSYRDLRTKQAYYVDKTPFIEEFLDSWYQITLITRPRRFGKTLNMSMLAEFLDCTKDSADIFEGTKVYAGGMRWEMNQHPVVFLSFLNVKADSPGALIQALKDTVRTEYERYYTLLDDKRLPDFQREEFQRIYESLRTGIEETIKESLVIRSVMILCQTLYLYYGRKIYLLLDEYDTPFMSANSGGYYEEVKSILNGMLSTSLKGNPFLEKGILTGIQRVAKENIFSGLNNLMVCTVRDKEYEDCFGFTEEEVRDLLAYCKMEFSIVSNDL